MKILLENNSSYAFFNFKNLEVSDIFLHTPLKNARAPIYNHLFLKKQARQSSFSKTLTVLNQKLIFILQKLSYKENKSKLHEAKLRLPALCPHNIYIYLTLYFF
jgi:hypothetical protein